MNPFVPKECSLAPIRGWRRWLLHGLLGRERACWPAYPVLYYAIDPILEDRFGRPDLSFTRGMAVMAQQERHGLWGWRWRMLTDRAFRLEANAEAAAAELAAVKSAGARLALKMERAWEMSTGLMRSTTSTTSALRAIDAAIQRARGESE